MSISQRLSPIIEALCFSRSHLSCASSSSFPFLLVSFTRTYRGVSSSVSQIPRETLSTVSQVSSLNRSPFSSMEGDSKSSVTCASVDRAIRYDRTNATTRTVKCDRYNHNLRIPIGWFPSESDDDYNSGELPAASWSRSSK
jgi:hypothetical protein